MDAHAAEYDAAAAGMAETYGTRRPLPAVGEHVRGAAWGKRFAGEVVAISDRQVTVAVDMAWLVLDPSDLEID